MKTKYMKNKNKTQVYGDWKNIGKKNPNLLGAVKKYIGKMELNNNSEFYK